MIKESEAEMLISSEPNYTAPDLPEVAAFMEIAKRHHKFKGSD